MRRAGITHEGMECTRAARDRGGISSPDANANSSPARAHTLMSRERGPASESALVVAQQVLRTLCV